MEKLEEGDMFKNVGKYGEFTHLWICNLGLNNPKSVFFLFLTEVFLRTIQFSSLELGNQVSGNVINEEIIC